MIVEAEHLCVTMRDIQEPGSIIVTSATPGICDENKSVHQNVLSLITSNRECSIDPPPILAESSGKVDWATPGPVG